MSAAEIAMQQRQASMQSLYLRRSCVPLFLTGTSGVDAGFYSTKRIGSAIHRLW
jgi:hypothetical protein